MIGAVILAAGESARLGRPKQLVEYRGTSLVRRAVVAALEAGCEPVVVVLGAQADAVRKELVGLSVHVVVNPDWQEGVSTSVRTGIEALDATGREPQGALLLACDQPNVDAGVLSRLCEAFDGSKGCRVAAEYSGTAGIPAIFERSLFGDLRALKGDRGAKPLLEKSAMTRRVECPEAAFDVNRPEDCERLT